MGYLVMALSLILLGGSTFVYFRWYGDPRTDWALLTYVFSWVLMTIGVWQVTS